MTDYLKITCPFSPCGWFGEPIRQQARFGDPETNWVMPIHEVVGEGSWFGRCPGSMLIVPEVTSAGLAVLGSAHREYLKRKIERQRAEQQREAERAAAEPDGPVTLPNTSGIADLIRKGAARVDPRLGGDMDAYFPGRPADAPEPGPGDPPAPLPEAAEHATIVPLGGTMDNARSNLNALITLCASGLASTIEDLARVMGQIERAQSLLVNADETAKNAQQLIMVTVGTDSSNEPEPARNMKAMAALGRTTMSGSADQSVTWSLDAAHEAVTAAMNQFQAAKLAAEQYLAMPK